MTETIAAAYLVLAIAFGAETWHHTRDTWEAGALGTHIARCVLITVIAGLFWPARLAIDLILRLRSLPDVLERLLFDAKDDDDI